MSFMLFLFVKERGEGPGKGVASAEKNSRLADDGKRLSGAGYVEAFLAPRSDVKERALPIPCKIRFSKIMKN